MAPSGSTRRRRTRGEIETLPNGSLRVRVYAGIDPISGKRHYLSQIVPAGRDAAKEAEKVRTRFQAEVDDRRSPRTKATVAQLMERYLDLIQVEDTTRAGYEALSSGTSARCSASSRSAGSTARPSTRSTVSSAGAGSTAAASGSSSTGLCASTNVTSGVGRTSASR